MVSSALVEAQHSDSEQFFGTHLLESIHCHTSVYVKTEKSKTLQGVDRRHICHPN